MFGLTVRWSLVDAPADAMDRLRAYVSETSHAKFAGLEGLSFKSWRAREGEWFEGCYVFDSNDARSDFQENFESVAATSEGSKIIGSAPFIIEPCEIVGAVAGPSGFRSSGNFEA